MFPIITHATLEVMSDLLDAQTAALVASSPAAIAIVDDDDVIAEWNPAAERYYGYGRPDTIGAKLGDLIIPVELRGAHRDAIESFRATADPAALPRDLTVPARRADGTTAWTALTLTPLEAGSGDRLLIAWLRQMHRAPAERRDDPGALTHLEALVNNISDVITVLDAHGQWLSSSSAGTRILGWEPGLDPEGGIYALVHPDDREPTMRAFAEVIAGTRTSAEPIDIRVMDLDGHYRVLQTVAENLIDDPRVGGVVLTSRDVTVERADRAALEVRTARLLTLVKAFGDAVMVVDEDRRIALANDAFVELFTVPHLADALLGRSSRGLFDEIRPVYADDEEVLAVIEERYADDEPVYDEIVTLVDGRVLERDSIPIIYGDGNREHMWVFRDVTEREQLTRRRADQLADTLRAQLLAEERHQALLELTEMRSQFVATISHELRTPLSSIVSFADLLTLDLDGDEWAEQRSFVEAIDRNAKRLLGLVDDLLLLRQLEAGALPLVMTSGAVRDLVNSATRTIEPLAAARRQQLTATVGDGPPITGDLRRLDQVLVNLISNAVKFTAEEGVIAVTASYSDEVWSIAVADTGVGIPDDERANLFAPFYRGSYSSAGVSGTGLGLLICKAVVELHHGTIHVDSAVGVGTTMTVELPVAVPWP